MRLTARRLAAWLTALRLSRDHSVRFPDGASFVAVCFKRSLAIFAQSCFSPWVVALCVCLFGIIGGPRHCQPPVDGFGERTRRISDSSIRSRRAAKEFNRSTRRGGAHPVGAGGAATMAAFGESCRQRGHAVMSLTDPFRSPAEKTRCGAARRRRLGRGGLPATAAMSAGSAVWRLGDGSASVAAFYVWNGPSRQKVEEAKLN
jgi:hypothetical protein